MNIQNFDINLHHYKDNVPLSPHFSWRMSKDKKSYRDIDHEEQKLGVAGYRGSGPFTQFLEIRKKNSLLIVQGKCVSYKIEVNWISILFSNT